MALSQKARKRLRILIPVAVVVVAAVVVTVVLLFQNQPKRHLQDISAYDDLTQPVMVVEDGLEEMLIPLPRYPVSDQVPEGYTWTQVSAQTANRFSLEYQDVYYTPEGYYLNLRQQSAGQHMQVGFPGDIQHAKFAGMDLYYASGETGSTAAWLKGDTLFVLESNQPNLSLEEMLEFVNLIDYDADPAPPETSPFTFIEGKNMQFGNVITNLSWKVGGNPALPDQLDYYTFTQAPEGYTQADPIPNTLMDYSLLQQAGIDAGEATDGAEAYQNSQGGTLTLTNGTVGQEMQIFTSLPISMSTQSSPLETVTVNGMEGRLYSGSGYSELVLLGDYLYVDLTYQGTISREDFLALAQLVGR